MQKKWFEEGALACLTAVEATAIGACALHAYAYVIFKYTFHA
jgi:hypothetical protein